MYKQLLYIMYKYVFPMTNNNTLNSKYGSCETYLHYKQIVV